MKPQLALHLYSDLDKKKPYSTGKEYAVFEKYDGWYGYADLPSCIIHSRAGREIPALVELSDAIRKAAPKVRGRLIFEILIDDVPEFHELNGILNRKYEQAEGAYIRVHDFLPDFKCDVPLSIRYQYAAEIVERINLPSVSLAPILGYADTPEKMYKFAEAIWKQDGEGVILKEVSAGYSEGKRNASLLKIKEDLTLDLLVVGTVKGQGKYSHMIGAIQAQDKLGRVHLIGSGLTDDMRMDHSIVGQVVEIKAMKQLKDGSLREPRLKAIRYDKLVSEID